MKRILTVEQWNEYVTQNWAVLGDCFIDDDDGYVMIYDDGSVYFVDSSKTVHTVFEGLDFPFGLESLPGDLAQE